MGLPHHEHGSRRFLRMRCLRLYARCPLPFRIALLLMVSPLFWKGCVPYAFPLRCRCSSLPIGL